MIKTESNGSSFLIESEILEKLKPAMAQLIKLIRSAIDSNQPIIVRHHADCDGYVSGIALENAILPLILQKHGSDRYARNYYKRVPSKTPFYDYSDASRDAMNFLNDAKRNKTQPPLIILADHGSAEENVRSIGKVTLLGAQVAIIDHHDPGTIVDGKAPVDTFVKVHVSTHLVGHKGTLCAGQLSVEFGRLLNLKAAGNYYLAALAGLADRVTGTEMDAYMALAHKEGYDEEKLRKIARLIDYEAHFIAFNEAREFVHLLLGKDSEARNKLAQMIHDRVEFKINRHRKTAAQYHHEETIGSIHLGTIDVAQTTFRSDYVNSSKIARLVFDILEEKYDGKIIVLGHSPGQVTIRASRDIEGFDLNRMREEIDTHLPHAVVSGGGHAVAGTLRFVSASHDEVMAYIHTYIEQFK